MIDKITSDGSLIGLIGIFLALLTYFFKQWQEYKNTLNALSSQINAIKAWARADDEGWSNPPTEEDKLGFVKPFYLIFIMDNSIIKQTLISPGIVNFSQLFVQAVAHFNQQILRIHTIMNFRNNIALENFELSQQIEEKLSRYRAQTGIPLSFEKFMESLNDKERNVAYLLYEYNKQIHTDLIGRKESGGLKNLFHLIENELQSKKDNFLLNFILSNKAGIIFLMTVVTLLILRVKVLGLI